MLTGLLAFGACATSQETAEPEAPAAPITLSKGATAALPGTDATITARDIVYIDSPCPPDVKCVWSGVKKTLEATVTRGGESADASLGLAASQVVLGIKLVVRSIEPDASRCTVEVLNPTG